MASSPGKLDDFSDTEGNDSVNDESEEALDLDDNLLNQRDSVQQSQKVHILGTCKKPKSQRFSPTQSTILNRYYNNGMCGVGKRYESLISCAMRETKLTSMQVKVCNYRCITRYITS